MSIRTSFSQNSSYKSCPKFWDWNYNQKLRSPIEGASTYFGSAVDFAVMHLLENGLQSNYMKLFHDNWKQSSFNNKTYPIFDNPNIAFSNADFDEYVLKSEDHQVLMDWAVELGLTNLGTTGVEIQKEVTKIKKNPYIKTSANQLVFFNRASWLSLNNKGRILIEAFVEQFYPKIKKVLATQKQSSILDSQTGDSIVAMVDMIVELEGYDKPIILDLKTASQPYTQEHIDLTEQLTLYLALEGSTHQTDLVGYVVLCKNIQKEEVATCNNCGYIKDSRHQTCNSIVNNERCGGTWKVTKKLKPEVQLLTQRKTQDQIQDLFKDYSNIIHAMKEGIVYKNTDKCENWYGGRCPYYNACHKQDTTGLIKK